MMTGRLPIRIGFVGDHWLGDVLLASARGGLPHNETTLPELLGTVGYASLALGKWHLGQQPQHLPTSHGFDSYYGIPYSVDMGSSAWDYFSGKHAVYNPPLPLLSSTSPGELTILEQPTDLNLLTGRYVHKADRFIANHSSARRPWLLYMAFSHVHTPDFASTTAWPKGCNVTLRGRFGDALFELDEAIGSLLASVRSAQALESTLVLFTSDNGPWLTKGLAGGSAGLLRDGKQTTWEGGVRVPGLASWTGRITPGRVSTAVVATYDIFVTALALAGVPLPKDRQIDGRDISELLFNDSHSASPHDCIYHWKGAPGMGCPAAHPDCPGLFAVRCGAYKMHWVTMDSVGPEAWRGIFHDPPLLYQLEYDPSEAHPVDAKSAEYASIRKLLEAAKAAHLASIEQVPNQVALGQDADLKVCCDVDSKHKYPTLPVCTCAAQNFRAQVCEPVGHHTSATVAPGGRVSGAEGVEQQQQQQQQQAEEAEAETSIDPFDPLDDSTWPARPMERHKFG